MATLLGCAECAGILDRDMFQGTNIHQLESILGLVIKGPTLHLKKYPLVWLPSTMSHLLIFSHFLLRLQISASSTAFSTINFDDRAANKHCTTGNYVDCQ